MTRESRDFDFTTPSSVAIPSAIRANHERTAGAGLCWFDIHQLYVALVPAVCIALCLMIDIHRTVN